MVSMIEHRDASQFYETSQPIPIAINPVYGNDHDAIISVVGLTIFNSQMIWGVRNGIYFGGASHKVYNQDTMMVEDQFVAYKGGNAAVVNSGAIYGGDGKGAVPAGAGIEFAAAVPSGTVTNHASGAIHGPTGIYSRAALTKVANYGSISGDIAIELGTGAVGKISNTGTIEGATHGLLLTASGSSVLNTGTISSSDGLSIQALGTVTVTNQGQIQGEVQLRGTLKNSGMIDGDVRFAATGTDADIVRNSGFIEGDVWLGNGGDTYIATGNGQASGIVFGGAGNDRFTGGSQADGFSGGDGRDVYQGGAGSDTFDFNTVAHIGKAAAERDVILDFAPKVDRIDLSGIDARSTVAGNQAFTFIATEGASFSAGVAGQICFDKMAGATPDADRTLVFGDVNGDKISDFTLHLQGLVNLTIVDFIL